MSQKIFRKGFLALAVTAAMGMTSLAQADVVIGVAGPHTGANASFGEQYWRGATQAAEDINAAGGVNGEKIKLVKADDACEPKQAVAVANRLVDEDKAVAVVGHFCSSSTIPASEVYDEAGIIAITPGSTNPQVTERGLSGMFRMCGRDDQQGIVAGDYIVDVLKAKKVAVIHDKDTYGQGLADATRAQLNKRGVKEVLYEGLTRGEKDFNALVTKIRASGAEVVYFGGLHPEAGPLVRQMREQGLTAKFMGPEGVGNSSISAIAGKASEGLLVTLPRSFDQDPKNQALVQAFKDKKQDPSGPFVFPSYAAVQVIAEGIAKAGDEKPEDVAKALRSNTFNTPTGELAFDEKGDLKNFEFVVYEWHADGTKTEAK